MRTPLIALAEVCCFKRMQPTQALPTSQPFVQRLILRRPGCLAIRTWAWQAPVQSTTRSAASFQWPCRSTWRCRKKQDNLITQRPCQMQLTPTGSWTYRCLFRLMPGASGVELAPPTVRSQARAGITTRWVWQMCWLPSPTSSCIARTSKARSS